MIGDEHGVGVFGVPEKHHLILALLRYQSFVASNSIPATVSTRHNEPMKDRKRLVESPVSEDVGVFTGGIVDGMRDQAAIGL